MRSDFDIVDDFLSELSRATTAYHDAPIDLMEDARQEYLEALRNFNSAQERMTCIEESDFDSVEIRRHEATSSTQVSHIDSVDIH